MCTLHDFCHCGSCIAIDIVLFLSWGKGSGEHGPNHQSLFCGMHQWSHAKLGQYGCVGNWRLRKAWILLISMIVWVIRLVQPTIAMLHSCGKLVIWLPELRSDWCMEIRHHRPKDSVQVYQILLIAGGKGLGMSDTAHRKFGRERREIGLQ